MLADGGGCVELNGTGRRVGVDNLGSVLMQDLLGRVLWSTYTANDPDSYARLEFGCCVQPNLGCCGEPTGVGGSYGTLCFIKYTGLT